MTEPYWEPLAAAPSPSGLIPIFDVVVGRGQAGDPAAPAASFDTNTILGGNIPQIYKHLQLELLTRVDASGSNQWVQYRFNNDSGTNYYMQYADANGVSQANGESLAGASGSITTAPAASSVPGSAAYATIKIGDYASTYFHKALHSFIAGGYGNATSQQEARLVTGRWASTAAITRMVIFPATGNFVVGSRLSMYGLA